jgi:hypothetical protein
MSANTIHERIARIARDELDQLYVSKDDQAQAMAAAVMTGLREDGVAIVELPEPLMDVQPFGVQWRGEAWSAYRDDTMVCTTSKVALTPAAAREYAAGLLAAASAAEAGAE